MPDDEEITEQTEEEIDDAESAFGEEEDEKEEKTDDKLEKDTDKEKAEDAEKDAELKEDGEEDQGEDDKGEGEKEDTLQTRLDKRLETVTEEEGEDEEPPDKKTKESDDDKKDKKPPDEIDEKLTKEKVVDYLNMISDDDLPGQMVIGDIEINLQEYAKQYPEEFGVIKVVASSIAQKIFGNFSKNLNIPDTAPLDERISEINTHVTQLAFDNAMAQKRDKDGNLKHPDYYEITRGAGMKDFHKWIKGQNKKIQSLAASSDPEDGDLLLSYYKEQTAKKKVEEHDSKSRKTKKEYDDIHSHTTRSDKSIKERSRHKKTYESPEQEAEASFLEG